MSEHLDAELVTLAGVGIESEVQSSLETSQAIKMLAIMEQWEKESGRHTDNTEKYLFLMLLKLGMDASVLYLCCQKLYTSFFNMCSVSIVLADTVMAVCFTAVWFFRAEPSPVAPCFFLAHTSAIFGALPLPAICLGMFDYCTEDTYVGGRTVSCKFLKNVILTLLVWTVAVIYSFGQVNDNLMDLDYSGGIKASVCEVQESTLETYFIFGLFVTVICIMLPFCSSVPLWVREADRLSELREEHGNERSDLFISTPTKETKGTKEQYLRETTRPRPPLWLSFALGFTTFWMPYLAVAVACQGLGFGVPAYVSVNVLWFECTNSLLTGMVFLVKSRSLGPYSNLPENVCQWHVYWHLSKGTRQPFLPTAVFNPSKGKINTLFNV